ncbi:hypothetical protein D8674_025241 [Pyrus ussuriensis x Pyrus communis]|uniref:Uncharacterized protein n=1 Tax=Pyrus ussuriensis x Pyrus communis TaxID=2448454 RepID=A0A5N5H539_9ROSA|nr:hypothetical protein D8674_025241 [Pyrus ussuriensis x Pyrus communis]
MNIVEIVCRASAFSSAQVFPTPPPSPAYLSFSVVLFVGFHGLHPDSWLPLCCCWLSIRCGCARGADRGRMLLMQWRRLSWMLLASVKLFVCLGCNSWLVLLYCVLSWPTFCFSMCLFWVFCCMFV